MDYIVAKKLIEKIIVAKILDINKHSNADRLLVTKLLINNETQETVQVVTGAKNISVGNLAPYLAPGNAVPGFIFRDNNQVVLQSKEMRGELSQGMILAEDEVGVGEDHEGIMILITTDDKIGLPLTEVLTIKQYNKLKKIIDYKEPSKEIINRIEVIKSIANKDNGGEIVGEDELVEILASGEELITYDGFEPSGQMHIAQGVIRAINTNKMISVGFKFKMYVADWFGYLNNKMGGDLEKIKEVGKYFIEIWKAVGMNMSKTEFLWTSEVIKDYEYWETLMKVSRHTTLKRILRTTEIMGRSKKDDLSAAQILYPAMQVTDIFKVIKCQVTQLGMDQRKVNMLAREIGESIGYWKPVIVSHGMLQGLQKPVDKDSIQINISGENNETLTTLKIKDETFTIIKEKQVKDHLHIKIISNKEVTPLEIKNGESIIKQGIEFIYNKNVLLVKYYKDPETAKISMKMSKSKPDTAIFMTDSKEEVTRKIKQAYCPPAVVENNPILAYCKQIIFESKFLVREKPVLGNDSFIVKRDRKFGGDISFSSYEELENDYKKGGDFLHSEDLKKAVATYINLILEPVREHFEKSKNARELLNRVKQYQITR